MILLIIRLASGKPMYLFSFGVQDEIQRVLKGPNLDNGTYLGHRVTTHSFIFPYFVESNGLVFGITLDPKHYYRIPDVRIIEALQKTGELPQTIPTPRLTLLDILYGFLWEILIFAYIVNMYLRHRRTRMEP